VADRLRHHLRVWPLVLSEAARPERPGEVGERECCAMEGRRDGAERRETWVEVRKQPDGRTR
jgi:hypothetical protein